MQTTTYTLRVKRPKWLDFYPFTEDFMPTGGVMTHTEYENRENRLFRADMERVERAPLAERKENAARFFEAIREMPEVVADRADWILAGHYGYGAMQYARRILGNTRMNREAALCQLTAALQYSTSNAHARKAWNQLDKTEQDTLNAHFARIIEENETVDA